jgi:hypothetical protein
MEGEQAIHSSQGHQKKGLRCWLQSGIGDKGDVTAQKDDAV